MTSAAVALYRLTRGRVLGRIGGQPVLLLETIGRRTGRRRTTPLQYLAEAEAFVVVHLEDAARKAGRPLPLMALTPTTAAPEGAVRAHRR